MSRAFVSSSSQYLAVVGTPPVIDVPVTLACWMYCTQDTATQGLMGICDESAPNGYIGISVLGDEEGDPVRAFQYGKTGSKYAYADSTIAYSANTWQHVCGVLAGDADRSVYLDGGNKGTDATDAVDVSTWDVISIAGMRDSSPGYYFDGRICEAAVWNVALSDAEAAILAKGFSPLFVRPANLVAYCPLIRTDQDWAGGYNMTAYNSPTFGDHAPKVIYPVPAVARVSGRGVFVTHT